MKIAVLSDVHGNLPALEVVLDDINAWRADRVIVNGDLINRGPYSLGCMQAIKRAVPDACCLVGNHEDYVLSCEGVTPDEDHAEYDIKRMAFWTCNQLGNELEWVKTWQRHIDLTGLEGGSLHITHGSRLGNRDGIFPETVDQALPDKLGEARDLFIASHTHKAMVKPYHGNLVVNVGSVGQPLDRDPRTSYGRFSFSKGSWQVEIRRLAFDRAQAARDFDESGFLEAAGPLGRLIFKEYQQARSFVGPWMRRYHAAVCAGEISVYEGVKTYLEQ